MSQHDYDIATADANTGVTFRAAVNAALQALSTCSSGATAPATTYPYMLWADTAAGYLKQRNAANTAWLNLVSLGSDITSVLAGKVAKGTASAPLFCDISNDDTTLAIAAGNFDTGILAGMSVTTAGEANVTANKYTLVNWASAPATATASGTVGEIRFDSNYMYRCIATNTWKRTALATW
jgi:hypothetical protein